MQHPTQKHPKEDSLEIKGKEWRCDCGRLLFKGEFMVGIIEVKCPRCKNIVYLQEYNAFTAGKDSFMVLLDPSGIIMSATAGVRGLLGFTPEEIIGSNINEGDTPEIKEVTLFWMDKVFEISETRNPYLISVTKLFNKEGKKIPFAFFAKATNLKSRRLIFAVIDADEGAIQRFSKRFAVSPKEGEGHHHAVWDFVIDLSGKVLDVSSSNKISAPSSSKGSDIFELLDGGVDINKKNLLEMMQEGGSCVATAVLPKIGKLCRICFNSDFQFSSKNSKYVVSISVK